MPFSLNAAGQTLQLDHQWLRLFPRVLPLYHQPHAVQVVDFQPLLKHPGICVQKLAGKCVHVATIQGDAHQHHLSQATLSAPVGPRQLFKVVTKSGVIPVQSCGHHPGDPCHLSDTPQHFLFLFVPFSTVAFADPGIILLIRNFIHKIVQQIHSFGKVTRLPKNSHSPFAPSRYLLYYSIEPHSLSTPHRNHGSVSRHSISQSGAVFGSGLPWFEQSISACGDAGKFLFTFGYSGATISPMPGKELHLCRELSEF